MTCALLRPLPVPYVVGIDPFLAEFEKYAHNPPLCDDMFAHGSETCKTYPKVPKPSALAPSE